jgi:hypothetical protein
VTPDGAGCLSHGFGRHLEAAHLGGTERLAKVDRCAGSRLVPAMRFGSSVSAGARVASSFGMSHPELVQRFPEVIIEGLPYEPRVYAARAEVGWEGWFVFLPHARAHGRARGPILVTERETTQPDLDAVRYWAGGLEPVYLQGAIARARPLDERLGRPEGRAIPRP